MNSYSCDEFQMAALAIQDGERPAIPDEDVARHVQECSICGPEIAGIRAAAVRLEAVRPRPVAVDLWPAVRRAIAPPISTLPRAWKRFAPPALIAGMKSRGALRVACALVAGCVLGLFLSTQFFAPGRAEAEALRAECARDLLASLNLALRSLAEREYLYMLAVDVPDEALDRTRVRNIIIAEDDGTIYDALIPTLSGRKIPVPPVGALTENLSLVTRGDPLGSTFGRDAIACWTRVKTTSGNVWICVVLAPRYAPRELAASAGVLIPNDCR